MSPKNPTKAPARCLHRERGECPQCAEFARLLIAAVEARDSKWRPGVLGLMNRAAAMTTTR